MSISSSEEEKFPCFYDIPGFSNYAISKEGVIINKKRNEILTGSRNPAGYFNFRLTDDTGYTLTWGRHRLLAFVFKHPGVNVEKMVVNHINAVKGDDRLDNLEWVTYQGNMHHAGMLGLTKYCMPISVRNVETGVVVNYPSIAECAREFGVSTDFINWRVKTGCGIVFPEGKQYKPFHSDEPWEPIKKVPIESMYAKAKSVLVRDVKTGEVKKFTSMGELSFYLKVAPSTLSVWLRKKNQPVFRGCVQFKWGDDDSPWREVGDLYKELEKTANKRTVKVVNDKTGEVLVFTAANECARAFNLAPTALNYRLKTNGKTVFPDGYRYSYY